MFEGALRAHSAVVERRKVERANNDSAASSPMLRKGPNNTPQVLVCVVGSAGLPPLAPASVDGRGLCSASGSALQGSNSSPQRVAGGSAEGVDVDPAESDVEGRIGEAESVSKRKASAKRKNTRCQRKRVARCRDVVEGDLRAPPSSWGCRWDWLLACPADLL